MVKNQGERKPAREWVSGRKMAGQRINDEWNVWPRRTCKTDTGRGPNRHQDLRCRPRKGTIEEVTRGCKQARF